MKTLFLSLFALALSFNTLFAQMGQATRADEATIKQILEAEKTALDAADYTAYKSHWARVSYASFLIFGQQYVGDALWQQMDKVWANVKPRKVSNSRTDWNIHIKGDAAFVTFSQRVEDSGTKAVSETVEVRYLEKLEGVWKIVNVTVVSKPAK